MKKALIVTYYWPPAGGPGVQRVLKFVKYLPSMGWKPLVLTVRNGEYPAVDETLIGEVPAEAEVFKSPSLEPGVLYRRFTGMKPAEKIPVSVLAEPAGNWRQSLAAWIRLNLFIPDAKRGWIPGAVRAGKEIIRGYNPDLIFSTSPPPTVHLIAKKLAASSRLPWVADFRDPWTDIHYYENQPRLKAARRLDGRYEQGVLEAADRITCISKLDIEMDFSKKVPAEKCINIPNGFDEEDFAGLKIENSTAGRFVLLHLGAVGRERYPSNLLKSIGRMNEEGIFSPGTFMLRFLGTTDTSLEEQVRQQGISELAEFIPYLPHREALAASFRASVMLLLITQSQKNRRILPGKTFEYMRTGKPILALGPENGEVARILDETGTGSVIDYENADKIYTTLRQLYSDWKTGGTLQKADATRIQGFSREQLTRDLARIFEELVNE